LPSASQIAHEGTSSSSGAGMGAPPRLATPSPPAATPTPAPPPESQCTGDGPSEPGPNGSNWPSTYMCETLQPASIYASPNSSTTPVDTMTSLHTWFLCKTDSGAYHPLSIHPRRWLLTQGDRTHSWGWMSDVDTPYDTDPLPNCPSQVLPRQ
jgi:hypothetical protein